MRNFKIALSFLTVIPVNVGVLTNPKELGNSAVYFPLVGALLGTVFAALAYFLLAFIPAGPVAGLLFLVSFLLTRGLHLDGLADMADGLTGGTDRDRSLAIMKDSSVGPMGAAAIFLVYLFKYALFTAAGAGLIPVLSFFMPVCGRWCMVFAGAVFPPARKEGLGNQFLSGMGQRHLFWASLQGITFLALFLLFYQEIRFIIPLFVGVLFAFIAVFLLSFQATRLLGGITGDILGASNEIAEATFLFGAIFGLGLNLPI